MGVYSVPASIRNMKPTGTMVKRIHDNYYVYEHKTIKDENGVWKTKMGKLIGRIDPNIGFISNEQSNKKANITTVDFGEYFLACSLSKDVLDKLIKVFGKADAYAIYIIAIIHFVNNFTYIKDIKIKFDQSYLSVKYSSLALGEKSVSDWYDCLGRQQTNVEIFEEMLIEQSSKELAFDGHCISNYSECNDLAEAGNKFNTFKSDQINVLMAYDINSNMPLLSRVFSGGTLDKVAIRNLISRKELKTILFIVDKGFYSKENIELFSANGNHYIIPLSDNLSACKQVKKTKEMEGMFVYEKDRKRSTVEYHKEVIDGKSVIYYRDLSRNALESTDYLSKVENGSNSSYTMEKYLQIKDEFGAIVLESNLDSSAEVIYKKYKSRWSIETFYDYYKHGLDVNAICLSDYYSTQGFSFIMLIASLIYSSFKNKLKEKKVKESIHDLLLMSKFLKLHKNRNGKWSVENINSKHIDTFKLFDLNMVEEANFLTVE